MHFALAIYRRLAEAFPHEFKLVYGAELMQAGEDVVDEIARKQGVAGLIRLIADLAVRLPLEYLSEMRRDLRYAWRALIKSPGFALVAILSMGIGIGLTTTVYSGELAVVFRKLPGAANAQRLVMPEKPVSYFYVEQYREQKSLLNGVAAFQNGVPFNVILQGDTNSKPARVSGQLVSPDYFSVLGIRPQRGRLFSADLDRRGAAATVVISDRFWRYRLNASVDAVGQALRLNGQIATIVGIAPKNFNGAGSENPSELFVPVTVPAALAPELANGVLDRRDAKAFLPIMCLAPGVTLESAEVALDAITRRLDAQVLSAPAPGDKSRRVTLMPAGVVQPIPIAFRRAAVGFFVTLMALIMTIVCMNLANMLLARAAARRKELAIRLSIGASRFRLVRQMITEGLLLSLLGGAVGLALAQALAILFPQVTQSTSAAPITDVVLDWGAAGLAFGLAILCGIGFSIAPALRATKADVTPALKQGSALQLPGYRRFGLRNFLMVAQVAGSLMLLLMTAFLALGARKASIIQTKFDPNTLYLLSLDPVRDGYSAENAQALFEKLPARLNPSGAFRVALAAQPPFSIEDRTIQLTAEDSRVEKAANKETVGAGYFATLNEPMLAGREFDQRDERISTESAKSLSLPVILNESAARSLFGNQNALGERIKEENRSYEVIGVVHDLKNGLGIRQSVMYLPLTRDEFARPPAGGMIVLVRSDAGTDALSSIRNQLASIDPNLTIFNVQTLSAWLEFSRSDMRIAVRIYGGIGLFGLVLAAIGLAGVTAFVVTQRRKEIGIRMALGARKAQVLRLVLREGAVLVTIGSILGFSGAILLAKLLSAMAKILADALQVGTNDPRLLVGAPLLLMVLTMIACYVPARKSIRIDPLRTLREE